MLIRSMLHHYLDSECASSPGKVSCDVGGSAVPSSACFGMLLLRRLLQGKIAQELAREAAGLDSCLGEGHGGPVFKREVAIADGAVKAQGPEALIRSPVNTCRACRYIWVVMRISEPRGLSA